jgi:hypothetical protein
MERSLVAAASVAAHLAERRQSFGLVATGRDPADGAEGVAVPVGSGRGHLMEVLGALGRLELAEQGDLPARARAAAAHLGWGATLVLITGQRGEELVAALLPLRRAGLNVALVIAEATPEDLALPRRHGLLAFGLGRDGRPSEA